MIYVALLAGLGGLWLAGVSTDRLVPIGLVALMFMMHMGGHGHGGHGHTCPGGHAGHDTSSAEQEPKAVRPAGEHSEYRGRGRGEG